MTEEKKKKIQNQTEIQTNKPKGKISDAEVEDIIKGAFKNLNEKQNKRIRETHDDPELI